MDYAAINAELAGGHPTTGAYSADDATAAGQMNALNRQRNRASMTASEIFELIDQAELEALSTAQVSYLQLILGIDSVDPFGKAEDVIVGVFNPGPTRTALNAARVETISRAVELGLGVIRTGDITMAKREAV